VAGNRKPIPRRSVHAGAGCGWVALVGIAFLLACAAAPAGAVTNGSTVLVDRPSGFGAVPFDGTNHSEVGRHALSANACLVVFSSRSDNLSATDDNAALNIFRLDRCSAGMPLMQVNTTGTGAPAEPGSLSLGPTISADGRFVAFLSDARNLHPAATSGGQQAYVKDLQDGSVELASRATGPGGAAAGNVSDAVITGDGARVEFLATGALDADNFDGAANQTDLYERDLGAGTTKMVSVNLANNAPSHDVSRFDADQSGASVVFVSENDAYVRSGSSTLLVSTGAGSDSANRVAIDSLGVQVAFSNGAIWTSVCLLGTCNAPTRRDQPKSGGGTNAKSNDAPFFASTSPSPAARVYWVTASKLDPADANDAPDIYGRDLGDANPDTAIHLMTGGNLAGGVSAGDATDGGGLVLFKSGSGDLPGTSGRFEQVFARAGGQNTNISQPAGQPPRVTEAGNAFIAPLHTMSDDGRFVAFGSRAPALGGSDGSQVLVRDVVTGTTTLASVGAGGAPANEDAFGSLDGSGGRVVFSSDATNLLPGVADGKEHVYLRDLAAGTTTLVDRTAGGAPSSEGASDPQISGDGTKVVFASSSPDLPETPPGGGISHVYEVNLATGATALVDRSSSGQPANKPAFRADISADGNLVAFESGADNLGGGTAMFQDNIYVRNLASATTTWVSVPQSGNPSQLVFATDPSISHGGNRIAFRSFNATFGYGAPDGVDASFVRDIAAGTTTLASTGPLGAATRDTFNPVLSGDGSKLAFETSATNLEGAHGGLREVYIRDLAAGTTRLAGLRDETTLPGRLGSFSASLNLNGGCVAFTSQSDDLVSGGYGPDFGHVYLRALAADCPVQAGPSADTTPPVISQLTMTRRRFAVGHGKTPRTARVMLGARSDRGDRGKRAGRTKPGTAFKFRLSEDASTQIKLVRERSGRRKGKRCVKPRKGLHRRCVRRDTIGTLTRERTHAGANRVRFTGRLGSRPLPPSGYSAVVVATDAAGNRSKPRSVKFHVVRFHR
jgi:Tol biopolymer transport system component